MVNRLSAKVLRGWPPRANLPTVVIREAPMATNLVSQIVEAFGPTIVSRIASSLGFD